MSPADKHRSWPVPSCKSKANTILQHNYFLCVNIQAPLVKLGRILLYYKVIPSSLGCVSRFNRRYKNYSAFTNPLGLDSKSLAT